MSQKPPKGVPTLLPCPDCGIEVEGGAGPHGLAWHACATGEGDPGDEAAMARQVFDVVRKKAIDPNATMDELGIETVRASLGAAILTGEANMQSAGSVLQGLAAVKQAGGDTTLADLLEFHKDDDLEEAS